MESRQAEQEAWAGCGNPKLTHGCDLGWGGSESGDGILLPPTQEAFTEVSLALTMHCDHLSSESA